MMLRRTPNLGSRSAGMTMLELVVTLVVLLVAVGGTLGSISSFVVLGDSARETTAAHSAARNVLEEMRTRSFPEVFARYNSSAADDPAAGPSPGNRFLVTDLQLRRDDADGMHGTILFPTEDAAPTVLREDLAEPRFGLPRDLDGDTIVDGADHSDDYQLLPVIVRVDWRSQTGNRHVEVATVLRSGGVR